MAHHAASRLSWGAYLAVAYVACLLWGHAPMHRTCDDYCVCFRCLRQVTYLGGRWL